MDLSDLYQFEIKAIDNKRLNRLLLRKLGVSSDHADELNSIESLALKGARILNSVNPRLRNPTILIFASDHGISKALSGFLPDEKQTHENLLSFLHGTAEVNMFAKSSGLDVKVIDMGVDHSFEGTLTYWLNHGTKFINRKQDFGTRNFHEYPAINSAELVSSARVGMNMVDRERKTGCNVIGFGELGRGGKFSAWCMAATLLDEQLKDLLPEENEEVLQYLDKGIKTHPKTHDVHALLTLFGSYDMAAIVFAMLRAAQHRMLILIDGLFTSTAALAASKISPEILDYCVFTHKSKDPLHSRILSVLQATPLLEIDLRSFMASGLAYSYPLLQNAMSLLVNPGTKG